MSGHISPFVNSLHNVLFQLLIINSSELSATYDKENSVASYTYAIEYSYFEQKFLRLPQFYTSSLFLNTTLYHKPDSKTPPHQKLTRRSSCASCAACTATAAPGGATRRRAVRAEAPAPSDRRSWRRRPLGCAHRAPRILDITREGCAMSSSGILVVRTRTRTRRNWTERWRKTTAACGFFGGKKRAGG